MCPLVVAALQQMGHLVHHHVLEKVIGLRQMLGTYEVLSCGYPDQEGNFAMSEAEEQ